MQPKTNKMGTMPIGKLIFNMSLPMMISMMVQALYNIVDSIFVAQINEGALTAVSMAFPLQSLMISVGAGTGVGINALLSKSLGEKNTERANKTATNAIILICLEFLLFLLVGNFAVAPFYRSQTGDAQLVQYGIDYASVVLCMSFALFTQMTVERLLQSTGKTVLSMVTQGVGAITNIIMDPILIFGLAGAPKLGVAGAAWATVIGQCLGATVGLILNQKYNTEIRINWKKMVPDVDIIARIYAVGFPSIIMQAIGSVMVYGFNRILVGFSTTAVAVFGVYFKMQSFIFMPIFGLNNGLVPIMAFNYGANNRKRVVKTIKYGIMTAVVIMLGGFVAFQLFAKQFLMLFDASENMMTMGITALRIISIHFGIAGFCIVAGSVFQAMGKGTYSLVVSILRQIVVLLPAAYLLSLLGDVNYVWWSFPIAEIVSLLVSGFYLNRIFVKIINRLDEGDE